APQDGVRMHCLSQRPELGGSHCSPQAAFMIPSPQRSPVSSVHLEEHPSQSVVLPSSHASAPQTTPSPQPVTSVQRLLHASQSVALPSSHSSPASTMPSPQTAFSGGSSILTNFPRPSPSFTSGSSEVQVHAF